MAELLVYWGTHWTETDAEAPARYPQQYAMRYRKGDVIDVYEDGRCRERPVAGSRMRIIRVPGLSVAEARRYLEAGKGMRRWVALSFVDGSNILTMEKTALVETVRGIRE